MRYLVLVVSVCGACAGGGGGPDACEVAAEVGGVAATVDGQAWSSAATWMVAGSSVQINAPATGGWWFSMVLQTTSDGGPVADAVVAGELPIDVDLGGGGGWVTFYPEMGESLTSKNGSGALTLVDDADGLAACFAFDAVSDAGDTVTVEDGSLVATPSDLR